MPTTDVSALLAELDPLPYPERMRLLAERAKENAAAGTLRGLLDALWSGDADHRHIALMMAIVARDETVVLAALRADDQSLNARALRAIRARPVDPDVLVGLLSDAPAATRARMYRLARRDTAVAEALIGPVRARFGDTEAAKVLAGCGHETVARLLPGLGPSLGSWSVLARRHPGPVLVEARRLLGELPKTLRPSWWSRHGGGVLAAAADSPDGVFELLEDHPDLPPVARLNTVLGRLAAADPARVVRLLTDTGQVHARQSWQGGAVLRRIAAVDTAALAAFMRSFSGDGPVAALLGTLPPARRAGLFDAITAGRGESPHPLPEQILAVLTHERRTVEAHRCLALPKVAGDERTVLRYTAFLPFAEAHPVLRTATRRHEPDERAEAYRLLVECAVRSNDPEALGTVLGGLDRLANEQDPVRSEVIDALASVPAARFRPADAGVLTTLVGDAVEARDNSWMTRDALGRLAVRVLAEHSGDPILLGWALKSFDLLFGTSMPSLGRLDHVLRKGQEKDFLGAVLPWLKAGIKRARFEPLFAVATALGSRAHGLNDLQALLRKACDPDNVVPVITRGIALWLEDRTTRAARVEEIVRGDTSTVTLPVVFAVLCTTRTDVLDLVLSKAPAGRHLAKGARWVPGGVSHVERWLPRQRELYARLLAKVAGDAGAQQYERTNAIHMAASLPGLGWAAVTKYVGSPNVALNEAALGALAWTDRPVEALEVLLGHVDGDRARVAAYAAGRAARFTPPSRLGPLLGGILADGRKVTSRKEAARLLSRLSVPGAMDRLAGVWRPTLHRDIKVAVVSAVQAHLDDPRAWQILDDAVDDAEPAVALAVVNITPLNVAPRHRGRFGGLVTAACAHPDPTVAAAAWGTYPSWSAWAPDAGDRIVGALADLDERVRWRSAAQAVVALVLALPDTDVPAKAVAALLDAETHPAAADRDRPAGQRLDHLVETLAGQMRWAPRGSGHVALVGAGGLLAAHPDHVGGAAWLLIAATDLASADTEAISGALAPVADLLAGRPIAAYDAHEDLLNAVRARPSDDPRALWSAAESLAERGDLAGGLFAVALVEGGAGHGPGWSAIDPPWRELMLRLRRHPEPEVRAVARSVLMLHE